MSYVSLASWARSTGARLHAELSAVSLIRSAMNHKLFTIGHSVAHFSSFVGALKQQNVGLVIDVRSRPRSQRFPHFDQIEMEQALPAADVSYLFMGEELGGRPEDP